MTKPEMVPPRARLAELDKTLAQLRAQYDVLMNAFKFDEARVVAVRIEAHEHERQALAAALPPPAEPAPPTPYAVARRPRGWRR
jgi:hypothetical protein